MLMLPDGFTTDAIFDRAEGGTPNANGAYFSVAGVGIDKYKGAALKFIDGFKAQLNGKPVDPYAILGAQAAQVLADAIAKSDGTRSERDLEGLRDQGQRRPDRQLRVQQER